MYIYICIYMYDCIDDTKTSIEGVLYVLCVYIAKINWFECASLREKYLNLFIAFKCGSARRFDFIFF